MANNVNNVSFQSPAYDYAGDISQIQRQQALADALRARAMEPGGGTKMVGNVAIRNSPLEGVAKLAQALSGEYISQKAREGQADLAKKSQADMQSTLAKAMQAYKGTPSSPDMSMAGMTGSLDEQDIPRTQAIPGDPAMAAILASQHPSAAQIWPTVQSGLESQKLAQALSKFGYGGAGGASAPPQTGAVAPSALGQPGAPAGGSTQGGSTPPGVDPVTWTLMLERKDWQGIAKVMQDAYTESRKLTRVNPGGAAVNNNGQPVFIAPTTEGRLTSYGANGPVQSLVPGALDATQQLGNINNQIEAQKAAGVAAARLPYQPPTAVNTPGAPMLMTPSQQIEAATGAPPPNPFQPQGARPELPITNAPDEATALAMAKAADARGLPFRIGVQAQQQNSGRGGMGNSQNIPGLRLQDQSERTREEAIKHAALGADRDFQEKVFRPAMDAAQTARKNNAEIIALSTNPIASQTGWGTDQKAWAANVLAGIAPSLTPDKIRDYAGNAQTFQAFVMERNRALLNEAKGVQTEGDAERVNKTFAQLKNTPNANAMLLDYSKAVNNNLIKKAEFFANNQERAIQSGNLRSLEAEWSKIAPSIWDDPDMKKWLPSTPNRRASDARGAVIDFNALPK